MSFNELISSVNNVMSGGDHIKDFSKTNIFQELEDSTDNKKQGLKSET